MDWKLVPSLIALRAFEATARLGNQSAAARELNVTHAAINQHIRLIEAFFAVTLFEKQGRELILTQAGDRYYRAISRGFAEIVVGSRLLLADGGSHQLRISVTPAIYEHWLLPRIQDFWSRCPEIHLQIEASRELIDLKRDNYDLAIRFGEGVWPPYQSEFLLRGQYGVFAASSYLEKHPITPQNLADGNWLQALDGTEFAPFHQSLGLDFKSPRHKNFRTTAEARAAMISGLGLLAINRHFLKNELRFGLATEIVPIELKADAAYYLVTDSARMKPNLHKLISWLKTQAQIPEQP